MAVFHVHNVLGNSPLSQKQGADEKPYISIRLAIFNFSPLVIIFKNTDIHIVAPFLGADGAISCTKICSDIPSPTQLPKRETAIHALSLDAVIPSVDQTCLNDISRDFIANFET
jgi:hypothetical protein